MLDAVIEGLGLTRIRLSEDQNFSRGGFGSERFARDFERAVLGTIVNDNDTQIPIVRVERRSHGSLDDFFFVVGGNQHRNLRLVGSDFRRLTEDLLVHAVINCRRSNKNEASRHEQVAYKKYPRNEDNAGVEDPKAEPVEPCCPKLARRQGGHHVRFGLAQQFVNWRNLISARPDAVDDGGKGPYRLGAIATAI